MQLLLSIISTDLSKVLYTDNMMQPSTDHSSQGQGVSPDPAEMYSNCISVIVVVVVAVDTGPLGRTRIGHAQFMRTPFGPLPSVTKGPQATCDHDPRGWGEPQRVAKQILNAILHFVTIKLTHNSRFARRRTSDLPPDHSPPVSPPGTLRV